MLSPLLTYLGHSLPALFFWTTGKLFSILATGNLTEIFHRRSGSDLSCYKAMFFLQCSCERVRDGSLGKGILGQSFSLYLFRLTNNMILLGIFSEELLRKGSFPFQFCPFRELWIYFYIKVYHILGPLDSTLQILFVKL